MEANFHPVTSTNTFVTVILPLALHKSFTYYVPEQWMGQIGFGKRVEVQFGKNRLYTALVIRVHQEAPEAYQPKPILSVIDTDPIVTAEQVQLWQWMAAYYSCTLGEVMNAALPANLKLASETRVTLSPLFDGFFDGLNDKEYLVAEALTIQEELSIEEIQGILDQKTVYPIIRSMLDKRVIYLKEDLKEKYKAKKVRCVRLQEPYASQRELLEEAMEKVSRSLRQTEALMALIQLERGQDFVRTTEIYERVNADSTVLRAMEKKGVVELYEHEISRIAGYEEETLDTEELSDQQQRAIGEIKEQLSEKNVILLQGVTGSGKTRVYVELIQEALQREEQVLYLVPEIALTTQLIRRLQRIFGDDIGVYHSRLNNNERVELWKAVGEGQPIILGPRSTLFLPFKKLRLVIVDEEHDQSFKQHDPAPRYQGRDTAIYLAQLHGAKTILGTATPSVESFFNARQGKYGHVEMPERFGGLEMPRISVVDAKEELKKRTMQSHFTSALLQELKQTLERGEQAILFQNRRGFAPTYRCIDCGWHSQCIHCDVSLTYHKFHNNLKCHYCGYTANLPAACPACGSKQLTLKGFGTEKIEDELKIYLPDARIGRMDLDTVRAKNAHSRLIQEFEEGKLNILVGTQMDTKGLDFDKVGMVGILSADQLLQFPDFRSTERAYQLMTQVAGRAGRKHKQGKVLIQAFNTAHPVLREVISSDFFGFVQRELGERHDFAYPPYTRLIQVTLKHKKAGTVNEAAKLYDGMIRKQLGERVRGPAVPYVSRVRTYYLMDFLIKLERDAQRIKAAKQLLVEAAGDLRQKKGLSGVRISIDVDPY